MKRIIAAGLSGILPVLCLAQNNPSNVLSGAEMNAQQRSADYLTGADMQRDIQTYHANYNNDGWWRQFWQQGGADSANWYQQLRIMRIHLAESQQRLMDSTNWIYRAGEIYGTDLKPATITRSRAYLEYIVTAKIDIANGQSASLSGALHWLQGEWFGRSTTDPTGQYLRRDFDILSLSTPDASSYQLAHGGGGSPDSSLFNLLISDDQAVQNTQTLSANLSTQTDVPQVDLSNPDYYTASANMAGYIIRPDAASRPTNVVGVIGSLFNNSRTDPTRLRSTALSALFNDLAVGQFVTTNGGNEVYVFSRPVQHTWIYRRALSNYAAAATTLLHYYQLLIEQLDAQLQQAYRRDQEMLGLIAGYRAQRDQQPALATVISSSQARQIFEAQVGNMQLSDIPLISIAAYALWAYVGPPWANIPCWPTTFGCINNPLYNTITAQLVRGLEVTDGVVYTGTQEAANILKNLEQQEEAITAIQDLETKKADLQTKQAENEKAYGDSSYHVRMNETAPGDSRLPTFSGDIDPLTQAAMSSAEQARRNSIDIQQQNKLFYTSLTNDGTMLDRASLRTAQEASKTRALNEMREVINNRQTLRAAQRNQGARREHDQEKIDQARSNIPQQ